MKKNNKTNDKNTYVLLHNDMFITVKTKNKNENEK